MNRAKPLGDSLESHDGTFVRRIRAREYSALGGRPDFGRDQMLRSGTPAGFVMLFDRKFDPISPANQFLKAVCGNDRTCRTQNAFADDLSQWWMYLGRNGVDWKGIDFEGINAYAKSLIHGICSRTGRPYASATIHRRVGTVEAFYHWAFAEGLINAPVIHVLAGPPQRGRHVDGDDRHWAKRRPGRVKIPKRLSQHAHVHPLEEEDLHAVLEAMGPNPLAEPVPGRPFRDRLIAQTAVLTGMRIEEVCRLSTNQIGNVAYLANRAAPGDLVPIGLEITKNGDPRTVFLPVLMWKALERYIDGEREAAIAKARDNAAEGGPPFREHTDLFVNGIKANKRDIGRPVTTNTVSRAFRRAIFKSNQVDKVTVYAPNATGIADDRGTVARHTFHDLRHTFAVTHFRAATLLKQPDPVKGLQSLLGHKRMSTTADTYLEKYKVDEAGISDAFSAWLRNPDVD